MTTERCVPCWGGTAGPAAGGAAAAARDHWGVRPVLVLTPRARRGLSRRRRRDENLKIPHSSVPTTNQGQPPHFRRSLPETGKPGNQETRRKPGNQETRETRKPGGNQETRK